MHYFMNFMFLKKIYFYFISIYLKWPSIMSPPPAVMSNFALSLKAWVKAGHGTIMILQGKDK